MLGSPGVCYVTQADFKHSEFLCLRLFYDGGSKPVILCGLFICHFGVLVLDAFTPTLGGPHSLILFLPAGSPSKCGHSYWFVGYHDKYPI